MDEAAPRGKYRSNTPTEQHQMDALGLKKRPDLSF